MATKPFFLFVCVGVDLIKLEDGMNRHTVVLYGFVFFVAANHWKPFGEKEAQIL